MSTVLYLKRYQYRGVYHYAKLLVEREPPLSEVLNFLNPTPLLEQREYNLELTSDRSEYQALFEIWEPIEADEFKRAYRRATAGEFQIYVNGKRVES